MTEVRGSSFLKRGTTATSASADPNPPILKMFEREDWTLFRTIEELQQKSGVRAALLRRLVLKELGDNELDAGGIKFGSIDDSTYFIEDDGSGLDGAPEGIAELFSIRRPPRSTKLLRLPQRGALGNGLRVHPHGAHQICRRCAPPLTSVGRHPATSIVITLHSSPAARAAFTGDIIATPARRRAETVSAVRPRVEIALRHDYYTPLSQRASRAR
jgi:hypothetical protein